MRRLFRPVAAPVIRSPAPGPSGRLGGVRRALAHPTYRAYTAGNAVSLIGTWIQRIAVGWLTWDITGSGTWLGLVAFADLAPAVIIGPLGGVLADRLDRLRLIRAMQTCSMLQALALFALTAAGAISIGALFALVLANGVIIGMNQPARLALVPALVPRADLAAAVAINSITFNLARFIGPAIAGALIVSLGVAAAFAANALSFVAFLIVLTRLRLAPRAVRTGAGRGLAGVVGDLAHGLRYVAGHGGVAMLLGLGLALSLAVRPFVELLPGFAEAVFAGGAETLATLSATVGIGAVAAGLWLAQRGSSGGLGRITLAATALAAVAVLGFVASDRLWLALPCIALAGFALVATGVSAQTLIQLGIDGTVRGRVLSLYGLIFRGGPALGALAMGAASELAGLRLPLAVGALLMLALAALAWRRGGALAALEAAAEGDAPP
jgi:predicted MFS family arabinose efflux permease